MRHLLVMLAVVLIAAAFTTDAVAAPGSTDPAFGTGGVTYDQFGQDTPASSGSHAVVVAPNGDIYTAGIAPDANDDSGVFVARYLPSGTLDASFGNGGFVVENLGLGSDPQTAFINLGGDRLGLALTASGEPVVVTGATDGSGGDEVVAFELTTAGTLDPAFGTGGVFRGGAANPGSLATAVAVQPDGRIVITGEAFDASAGQEEFFAERLTSTGLPDPSFADNGVYTHQFAAANPNGTPSSMGEGVIVEPNGALTFGGYATDADSNTQFLITRLTANGSPDPTFTTTYAQPATFAPNPTSYPSRIAETPSGDYVEVGETDVSPPAAVIAAVEFTANGPLNSSFGTSGTALVGVPNEDPYADDVAVEPDGDIDLSGGEAEESGDESEVVARLLPSGALDPAFGTGGVFEDSLGAGSEPEAEAEALAFAPDGDLIVAGFVTTSVPDGYRTFLQAIVADSPPSVSSTVPPASPTPVQPVGLTATTTTTPTASKPTASTTRTTTVTLGDQRLTTVSPALGVCTATSSKLRVVLSRRTLTTGTRYAFSRVALSIDSGVAHHRRERVKGKLKTVTTYTANATVTRLPRTLELSLKGLKRGTHHLKLVVTVTRTVVRDHRRVTVTVHRTATTTFTVC